MLSGVTIGQYYPGKSIIHKMDPRMKIVLILLYMISIFLCRSFISIGIALAFIIAALFLARINLKVIIKGVKPIIIVVIITALLNLLYGTGEPICRLWIFKITQNGIYNAVFMAMRVFLLVISGLMLTYTTTPTKLTDAIESLLKPFHTLFKLDVHSLAMTMTIALRFIPTLVEEVDKIMSAQKSRGADMESGGLIKRVKAIIPVLIPLFVSAFRRATDLSYAMDCRCYQGGEGRTRMNVMKLRAADYVSLAVVLVYFTGIILLKIFMKSII